MYNTYNMTDVEPLVKTIMGNYGEPEYTVIYHIHVTYDRCGLLKSTMSCNDPTLLLLELRFPVSCDPGEPAMHTIKHILEENWHTSHRKSARSLQWG